MTCPSCGNPDAYQGLASVDCPRPGCRYFRGDKSVGTAVAPAPNLRPMPNPSLIPNPPNPLLAGPQLSVDIISLVPKATSVHISFRASGDPGQPDKRVEFYWYDVNNPTTKTVCTLSNAFRYYVDGIDADGQTLYATHWLSLQDGIQPTAVSGKYAIEPKIYP